MIIYIKKIIKMIKEKREEIFLKRFYEIRYYITKFFEDLQTTEGSVELPAWIECQNLMEKLNITKDNKKTINFYYNRIRKYRRNNPVF